MNILVMLLALILTGCGAHHTYNPLEGSHAMHSQASQVSDHMTKVEQHLKSLLNAEGTSDVYMYWIINDVKKAGNMVVFDVTITVNETRRRFILGMTDGVIDMTKEIEPEAEVDCQHESDEYNSREQA